MLATTVFMTIFVVTLTCCRQWRSRWQILGMSVCLSAQSVISISVGVLKNQSFRILLCCSHFLCTVFCGCHFVIANQIVLRSIFVASFVRIDCCKKIIVGFIIGDWIISALNPPRALLPRPIYTPQWRPQAQATIGGGGGSHIPRLYVEMCHIYPLSRRCKNKHEVSFFSSLYHQVGHKSGRCCLAYDGRTGRRTIITSPTAPKQKLWVQAGWYLKHCHHP